MTHINTLLAVVSYILTNYNHQTGMFYISSEVARLLVKNIPDRGMYYPLAKAGNIEFLLPGGAKFGRTDIGNYYIKSYTWDDIKYLESWLTADDS